MNGIWERVIRSVRRIMSAILGSETSYHLDTIRSVFAEATTILNSRPLCQLSDDIDDLEALTPSHLLLQNPNLAIPPGIFDERDVYLRKQWKQSQFLADCRWKRWVREYIPSLQIRQKCNSEKRNIRVNDLVMIVSENLKRGQWPLGRVVQVYPGSDGRIRNVQVQMKGSVVTRPISKMCLLEESK
ncbi:Uncharacterised protein r2_g2306 [Pycnogonum litorale]